MSTTIITICIVALRKESVDRNCICIIQLIESGLSLSARRAWIEMYQLYDTYAKVLVALRKESVDRNPFHGLGREV